jgi:hypothetical protein
MADGTTYYVKPWSLDWAGNASTGTMISFRFDSSGPNSTVVVPSALFYRSASLTQITGTAQDAAPGQVAAVYVRISSGAYDWDDGTDAWVNTSLPRWFLASGAGSGVVTWNYTGTMPTWSDGAAIIIRSSATDSAGLSEAGAPGQVNFTVDDSVAVSSVAFPTLNAAYQSLSTLFGTMTDAYSGVVGVQIAIKDAANNFWGGAAFDVPLGSPDVNKWRAASFYAPGSTWSYINANLVNGSPGWVTNNLYKVYVQAADAVGNTPAPPNWAARGVSFRIDFSSPVAVTTSPANGAVTYDQHYTQAAVLAGTFDDDQPTPTGSGVNPVGGVMLRVSRIDSTGARTYLTPLNSWDGDPVQFPHDTDNGSPGWTKTWAAPSLFADGWRYEVQARGLDVAGNTQATVSTSTFIVDMTTPSASAGLPAANNFYNADGLTALTGTANDAAPGGGVPSTVQYVDLEARDDTGGEPDPWWNFNTPPDGAWESGETSTRAVLTNVYFSSVAWSYSAKMPAFQSGRSYTVRMRPTDRSGNVSNFTTYTSSFTYDTQEPSSVITYPPSPDGVTYTAMSALTGTAGDATSGVNPADPLGPVEVSIQRVNDDNPDPPDYADNYYWDNTAGQWIYNSGNPVWNDVNSYSVGTSSWVLNTVHPDLWDSFVTYRVQARARDRAGNTEVTLSTRSFKFIPPPATVAIVVPQKAVPRVYYNVLPTITGTADNMLTEPRGISLQIQRMSDGWFVSDIDGNGAGVGPSFVNYSTWVFTGAVSPWSYNNGSNISGLWVNGSSYTIIAQGKNAGLDGTPDSLVMVLDSTEPVSNILQPTGLYTRQVLSANGNVGDPAPVGGMSAGIERLEVAVQDTNNLEWWTGSSWTASGAPVWNMSTLSGNATYWSYAIAYATHMADGHAYEIRTRAWDKTKPAALIEGDPDANGNIAVRRITYDVSAPTVTIASVANGTLRSGLSVASGT